MLIPGVESSYGCGKPHDEKRGRMDDDIYDDDDDQNEWTVELFVPL